MNPTKRTRHVMLRLSEAEHRALADAKPAGEELAVFARKALLAAVAGPRPAEVARRAAAFTVAALSPEITFEEALALFDEHVFAPNPKEVADGRRDQV